MKWQKKTKQNEMKKNQKNEKIKKLITKKVFGRFQLGTSSTGGEESNTVSQRPTLTGNLQV